jgi:hypothetical protein
MPVIVISCGRSGTNVAVSALSGHSFLKLDPQVENKQLFTAIPKLPDNYLSKGDIHYMPNDESFNVLMNKNLDLKVVWTIRDPRDIFLSKVRRGQSFQDGGDNVSLSSDGTPEGAISNIQNMFRIYNLVNEKFKGRIFTLKMEDTLLTPNTTLRKVCDFIGLDYEPAMADFPSRMKNKFKVQRYGRSIDLSQVGLWKNWKNIYDGFFTKQNYNVENSFQKLKNIVDYFNY